jgi:hypothetical protein
MINDLTISSPKTSDWKYVDDITFSEVVQENGGTESQVVLDKINSWASANDMRLNPNKCKEMIISFLRAHELPSALSIDGMPLDRVECHNVLGLTLQSNLKWNIFIEHTTSKASKRLHILRVLKRNGVNVGNVAELLTVYKYFVRSVLEYCAPVWHTSIPAFLSDEVEKVQKRAFRILHPENHYDEALVLSGCSLLSERVIVSRSRTCYCELRLFYILSNFKQN